MEYEHTVEILGDGRVRRFVLGGGTQPLSYADVLGLWQDDDSFRSWFISILAGAPFPAFRWETPPVTTGTVGRRFEFTILDSPWLVEPPNPSAFADQFATADPDDGIVVFENLGKDAMLVVPVPRKSETGCVELGAFSRDSSPTRNHALWRAVGRTMQQQISARPLWLSTAGGGVPWLHVRLDSRTKYYGFHPYRETA